MTTAEISAKRREAMAVARFDTLLNETTMALALAATTPSARGSRAPRRGWHGLVRAGPSRASWQYPLILSAIEITLQARGDALMSVFEALRSRDAQAKAVVADITAKDRPGTGFRPYGT